ncbi:MAG: DNA starvation/stationary phase protection protein [Tenericutes bacterium HGW-Tenericutes-5]|nr:MAG: DNA starvation/stationary phase protection protein [Tenericutes bacterium HGW-Tenericutes-5]
MNKTVDLLNQYLSDLAVMNTRLHNLHWNVTGKAFKQVHVYLEELYDDVFEKYDEVAERIKMLQGYPKASNKEYLETSKIKELASKDISTEDAFKSVFNDYGYLKELAMEVRIIADSEDDFVTVAILEAHVAFYDKVLYFVRQTLK